VRLVARLDIVWVHDIAQDFYGDEWLARFEFARTGAFRVLSNIWRFASFTQ
jgi:D-threo-aldose 1-dehydrogenase